MEKCHECSTMIDLLNKEYYDLYDQKEKAIKSLNFKFCLQWISVIAEDLWDINEREIDLWNNDRDECCYDNEKDLNAHYTFNALNFLNQIEYIQNEGVMGHLNDKINKKKRRSS